MKKKITRNNLDQPSVPDGVILFFSSFYSIQKKNCTYFFFTGFGLKNLYITKKLYVQKKTN